MPATPRSTGCSFGISGLVHGCILSWVALGTPPAAPEPRRNLYDELIQPHENRIIWYHLNDKMPDVAPGSNRPREMRASVKAPHTVVSGARDDVRPAQLIWMPEVEMQAPKPVPLPNVVAVAPKLRRPFTPPVPQPEVAKPRLTDAPDVAMPSSKAALPQLEKQQTLHRPWTQPAAEPVRKAAPVLTEAPTAALAAAKSTLPELGKQQALHRPWTQPAAEPVRKAAPVLTDAPNASLGSATASMPEMGTQRTLHRQWTPPAAPGPARGTAALPDAPAASLPPESTQTATLAIVGLNPAKARDLAPPTASRAAGFSAGAEIRDGGEASGTSTLVVPGLVTRGVPMMAGVLPIPRRDAMSAVRTAPAGTPAAETAPENGGPVNHSLRTAEAPDPRLEGRTVYSIAIQMPNVTSYYGSWLVWFAESKSGGPGGPLRAPSPVRKVDPKYIAAAASERVEGVVRLFGVIRGDGRVESISVIRHLDDRLDKSAAEALEKWQFEPAMRNGHPVEVDAVFEIPFRLAPRLTK